MFVLLIKYINCKFLAHTHAHTNTQPISSVHGRSCSCIHRSNAHSHDKWAPIGHYLVQQLPFRYTEFESNLAPMRCNAIIVFTALIQRFLITYLFSFAFVTDNSVFNADVISHGCFNAPWPDSRLLKIENRKLLLYSFAIWLSIGTNLGSFCSNLRIKSFAAVETWLKASSSKLYFPSVTLVMVSMSVSPWNGDNPDKST